MIIKTLVENTAISEEFKSQHGLSLHIETKNHDLLFDMGLNSLFIENAGKLGVDLSSVDIAVISHGHYDHGGGLKHFLKIDSKAKVYVNRKAFGDYYANRPGGKTSYIGLDKELASNERIVFVEDELAIDDGLELFSDVKGERLNPTGNKDLLKKAEESFENDDFAHEQNLVIKEDGKTLLVAGCAHNGIVNILDQFKAREGRFPDFVIGGFHLYNRSRDEYEKPETVDQIGEYLLSTGAKFYTCHCTGTESYNRLKGVMGENIGYLSTGSQIEI